MAMFYSNLTFLEINREKVPESIRGQRAQNVEL